MQTTEEEKETEEKKTVRKQQYMIESCVVRTTIVWINVSPAYTMRKKTIRTESFGTYRVVLF